MKHPFLWEADGALFLKVSIQPQAKRSKLIGPYADSLKIAVAAPALEGKANKVLIEYLAECFKIRKTTLSIKHGSSSRQKLLKIDGVDINHLLKHLQAILEPEQFS